MLSKTNKPKDLCPEAPLASLYKIASGGKAGAILGLKMATNTTKPIYKPTNNKPGTKAPEYISPTERPNWSAKTINTKEGGIACASVPEAVIVPVAIVLL